MIYHSAYFFGPPLFIPPVGTAYSGPPFSDAPHSAYPHFQRPMTSYFWHYVRRYRSRDYAGKGSSSTDVAVILQATTIHSLQNPSEVVVGRRPVVE